MTIVPVKIAEIGQETPNVRVLRLNLLGQNFEYKAGQWIDCYADIDDVRHIVGYSLTSSPSTRGYIELAVKKSDNPVSAYVHSAAEVGDTLYIEGGQGDIYYEAKMGSRIVLIAAGIGVAPLMGILRYIDEATDAEVTLLQSASVFDELIYFYEIKKRAEANPRIKYYPFVSREEPHVGVDSGRIQGKVIMEYGVDLDSLFYLSGPGGMIPELKEYLLNHGVDEKLIKYELWW